MTLSLGHNEICSEPVFLNKHNVHKCLINLAVKMVQGFFVVIEFCMKVLFFAMLFAPK